MGRTEMKTKIKDMTPSQRAQYQKEWYARKIAKTAEQTLHIEIKNCTPELMDAILSAIKESK
jgi:hypothetical protein